METVERSLSGRNRGNEHRGFLGQSNCSVWYYNDRCTSLDVRPNP